jgi:retron-type reverse transcriptase
MALFEQLVLRTGLSPVDLTRIINTAPARYKEFPIPKKTGGERIIAQPSRELKVLQRHISSIVLHKGNIHPAATAYKEKASIKINADLHKKNRVILKTDFKDFFHSIRPRDWKTYALGVFPDLSLEDIEICARILFWGRGTRKPTCLSIGAPTSPLLSNLIMFDLDKKISRSASKLNAEYTRYADDITVSAADIETVLLLERRIRDAVHKTKYPKLLFNDEKRGLYTTGTRRHVTGLNITPTGTLSIGRDRKRMISAMLHKYLIGVLSPEDVGKLKGYLSFAWDCEPQFVERMKAKYGTKLIDTVIKLELPKRDV